MRQNQTQRMCALCKEKQPKKNLLRMVNIEQNWVVDLKNKLPGRGYYFCKHKDCIELALTKGFGKQILGRNYSETEKNSFLEEIKNQQKSYNLQKIKNLIILGQRSKKIVYGKDGILASLKSNECRALILAKNASVRTMENWQNKAKYYQLPLYKIFTQEELGEILASSPKSCIAIVSDPLWQGLLPLLNDNKEIEDSVLVEDRV